MTRWHDNHPQRHLSPFPLTIPNIIKSNDASVTDDPLATLSTNLNPKTTSNQPIYSVSRSVYLPRVTLKNITSTQLIGVNPLFQVVDDDSTPTSQPQKSSSSGYGSSHDPLYLDSNSKLAIIDHNPNFIKSIKFPPISKKSSSGSSNGGTLTTIPEGRYVDPIPKPIWPSIDDVYGESLDRNNIRDVLLELLDGISTALDTNSNGTAEDVLKKVNEKITASMETLKLGTEEEMRRLCINLSNCRRMNAVLRVFGEVDGLYHMGSSSSGCSSAGFVHDDLNNVSNGLKNALIYGTICKGVKKGLLKASADEKPSVWEQYYGARVDRSCKGSNEANFMPEPGDVPLFPGGRPEADFTLDVPRSELLSKRMKQDKKWRCRCRLLTSFLGFVFFLLSVMAVSLILTKGTRMFGSMM